MDPYRSVSRQDRAEAPRDPGLVGDIIAQFADPLAFYRELVQNSIDAGSPSVDIKLEFDAGMLRVSVRDRGEGMTRDILENQLLVLFRSTKENVEGKIGKFGIGFASVLAPNPEVVAVHSSRDGRRLVLHLHRDLTYQLYDAGPATQTGTSVELDLAMRADEVEAFARRSIAALERWCRHASVPIHVAARLPAGEEVTARIDRPLGLDNAVVTAEARSADGKLYAVVGLTWPTAPYVGFFNHGLMLHETSEPLVGDVAVKLQDARLGHTLSRDDVRRDAHFERALELARGIVEHQLPEAASVALRAAADSDHDRWWTIVKALGGARLSVARRAWRFPLVEPNGEQRSIAAGDLPKRVFADAQSTEFTQRVARSGRIVIRCPLDQLRMLAQILDDVASVRLGAVAADLTAVTPIVQDEGDDAMLALVREHLAAVYRAPPAIVIARLDGALADVMAIAGDPDAGGAYVIETEDATKNPFSRKRPPLVINERADLLHAARRLDPRAAAALLVRALLLPHGLLDVSRSALLLERTLAQIGLAT